MYMKPDCNNYGSMCLNKTVIAECNTSILQLPMPNVIQQDIKSICGMMNMEACAQCNDQFSNCDIIQVYSSLCMQMPDMAACSDWNALCKQVPGWPICPGGSGQSEPIMRMYFHTGLEDYVLVKQWVPRTYAQYLLTALFIVCLGIFYEALKMLRDYFEMRWRIRLIKEARLKKSYIVNVTHIDSDAARSDDDSVPLVKGTDGSLRNGAKSGLFERSAWWNPYHQPFHWEIDIPRAIMTFFQVAAAYVLMLMAMTYNVGLFMAVCLGAAIGSLIFSRMLRPLETEEELPTPAGVVGERTRTATVEMCH